MAQSVVKLHVSSVITSRLSTSLSIFHYPSQFLLHEILPLFVDNVVSGNLQGQILWSLEAWRGKTEPKPCTYLHQRRRYRRSSDYWGHLGSLFQISPTRNTDPCVGDLVRHKGGIRNVCQIYEKKDPMQKKKLYMMQNNEALQVAYVEEVFT